MYSFKLKISVNMQSNQKYQYKYNEVQQFSNKTFATLIVYVIYCTAPN